MAKNKNKNIYPETSFDKDYGFKGGSYKVRIHKETFLFDQPSKPPEKGESLLYLVDSISSLAPVSYLTGANEVWFYYDNKWIKITKKDILNPSNLRMRRLFNEELKKLKE
jgi:hypothetical protein